MTACLGAVTFAEKEDKKMSICIQTTKQHKSTTDSQVITDFVRVIRVRVDRVIRIVRVVRAIWVVSVIRDVRVEREIYTGAT